ncbi:MAG: sigma-70 family RNA polymerase sigma factor [Acidobacteria bacterium]|nr:sigma-70 family RNA polymerase sigma factor [Acidobacteriota bacterium]
MPPYTISYDDFISPDENKRLEVFLRDRTSEDPEMKILRKEIRGIVRTALTSLPRRERYIIEKRFGLRDDRNLTLEAISKTLQLSKERVRQLEQEALGKLRWALDRIRNEILAA